MPTEDVTPTAPIDGAPEGAGAQTPPTTPPAPDPNAALNERIAALTQQQADLIAQLSQEATPPEVAPAPTPPPAPVAGRIKREDYDALADYAAQQAQAAERMRLAKEFGLEETDLDGVFASPTDMRRHAQILALQNTVTQLTSQLEAQAPPPEGEADTGPPTVDTGGPTGTQLAGETELAEAYQKAIALGRTEEGRRAFLQARYLDPAQRTLVREG